MTSRNSSPSASIEPRLAAITAGLAAIVVWGSLYPFAFYDRGSLAAGWRFLIETWPYPPDRGDVISNILLYLPLGLFGVAAARRPSFPWRVLLVTLLGTLLSATMELTQFWDVGRAPSVADLYSNAFGTLVGSMAAGLNPRAWNFPLLGKIEWRPFAVLLVLFWLGSRMFPYHPAFLGQRDAWIWKPLLSGSVLLDLYRHAIGWLAVALLLEALFGIQKSKVALTALVALLTILRLLIGVAVPIEECGALFALLLWVGIVSRLRIRAGLIAALFTAYVAVEALSPFHFLTNPRHFEWIPFISFIEAPRDHSVRVFFEKSFNYGTMVWLAARAGFSWAWATAICASIVFGTRLAQAYLPGRSAEITDAAMLVLLAAIMKLLRDVPSRY